MLRAWRKESEKEKEVVSLPSADEKFTSSTSHASSFFSTWNAEQTQEEIWK